MSKRVGKNRPSTITTHVMISTEAIDFDAWVDRYLSAVIAADRDVMREAA